jgi:hypothetical protein
MSLAIKESLKILLYQASKPILGKVGKFNGMHRGESCYIFGDGISVKSMNLAFFADKKSIATNYFPFHKYFNAINCGYCIINAPHFFNPHYGYSPILRKHLNGMAKNYKQLINDRPQVNYFVDLSNYPFIRGKNVFYTFRNIPDARLTNNFIGNRINCFSGVARAAIMLAIYLGFDHIYLVGFDYTHVPSRSLHWYEKGQGVFCPHENYNKDFFEIAKEFINITTITLDGGSDFINHITYKAYTGCEPVFSENTELIHEKYLKVLSSWPGYNVC